MPNELPRKDPENIWLNQPTEPFKMSVEEIRLRADQLEKKSRMEALFTIAVGLIAFVFFARTFATADDGIPRIGWGILSLWGVYSAYAAYRWIWPRSSKPDATIGTTVEFYKQQLENRRDYSKHIWRRSGLAFAFLGMALIILPLFTDSFRAPHLLWNAVPFFVLLAGWFVAFHFQRRRKQSKLQQQIDELKHK